MAFLSVKTKMALLSSTLTNFLGTPPDSTEEPFLEGDINEDLEEEYESLEIDISASKLAKIEPDSTDPIKAVQKASEDAHSKTTRAGYAGYVVYSEYINCFFD